MPRAQELLDQAIATVEAASQELRDERLVARAAAAVGELRAQRDKFFFKSLVGVPLANKAKVTADSLMNGRTASNLEALEAIVAEIKSKADAPGTVLT
ncbi:MAG: hypothetical protein FJ314_04100 [SAR202 cluster bacterium]|nr:hypothetical protein [SAR202 cluster bacterium]